MRIERKTAALVPAGCKLRPLRDQIIVKPLEWRPSAVIHIAGNTRKTLRGTIVAVGPGHYRKIYNGPKGYRNKMWEAQRFTATEVKCGDTIELGGLEIDGYGFEEIVMDNELHIVCREEDVVGVVDGPSQ